MDIPDEYEEKANQKFREWSKVHAPGQANNPDLQQWPWYADEWLLIDLGAQFRIIENEKQTLLRDIVYARRATGKRYTYSIGARALAERNKKLPWYDNYQNEPRIDITELLYTTMGLASAQCHEIEQLFSKAFVFAISERQQQKYETFNDFFEGWGRKTLGGIIHAMQEAFDIDTEIKNALNLFLNLRNQLVHGVTTKPRFDINTDWGQRELLSFFDIFLSLCPLIKDIATSCFEVSIEIANTFLSEESAEKIPLKTSDELLGLFVSCFKLKECYVTN